MSQTPLTKFFNKLGTPAKTQHTNGTSPTSSSSSTSPTSSFSSTSSTSKSPDPSQARPSPSQAPAKPPPRSHKLVKQRLFSDVQPQEEKKRLRHDSDEEGYAAVEQIPKKRHVDEDEDIPIQQLRKFMAPSKTGEHESTQVTPLLTNRSRSTTSSTHTSGSNGGGGANGKGDDNGEEGKSNSNKRGNMRAGFLFPDWLVHPKDANMHPVGHPEYPGRLLYFIIFHYIYNILLFVLLVVPLIWISYDPRTLFVPQDVLNGLSETKKYHLPSSPPSPPLPSPPFPLVSRNVTNNCNTEFIGTASGRTSTAWSCFKKAPSTTLTATMPVSLHPHLLAPPLSIFVFYLFIICCFILLFF